LDEDALFEVKNEIAKYINDNPKINMVTNIRNKVSMGMNNNELMLVSKVKALIEEKDRENKIQLMKLETKILEQFLKCQDQQLKIHDQQLKIQEQLLKFHDILDHIEKLNDQQNNVY
jgi:hypothetical protein